MPYWFDGKRDGFDSQHCLRLEWPRGQRTGDSERDVGIQALAGSLELANGKFKGSGSADHVDRFPGRDFYVEHARVPRTLCDEGQSLIDCSGISLKHCFDAPVGQVLYPPAKPQSFGALPRGLAKPDTLDASGDKDVNALATHSSVDRGAIAARSGELTPIF